MEFITEALKKINNDPSLLKTTYRRVGDGGLLGRLFVHAYMPEGKLNLPPGEPPYKLAAEPMGLTPSTMVSAIQKLPILMRPDKELSRLRREQIFIQTLENVHPEESKILIAVKDQNLAKLYPNITRNVLADAGFVSFGPEPYTTSNPLPNSGPSKIDPIIEALPVKKKRGRPPGKQVSQTPPNQI